MDTIEFKNEPLIEDETGLWLDGKCIMYCNEEPFIKAGVREICKRIKPKTVLEVGFGLGYTATEFQEQGVERHVIVEAHPEIAQRAIEWAKDKNAVIIHDFWENVRLSEEFDLLYYDPFNIADLKVDWSIYKYKWFAQMANEGKATDKEHFEFIVNNKIYNQLLETNGK